jgi:membrane-associated phospholipid phosphatase
MRLPVVAEIDRCPGSRLTLCLFGMEHTASIFSMGPSVCRVSIGTHGSKLCSLIRAPAFTLEFKVAYLVAGLAIGAGLVAANYHFLSDVIGGAFIGIFVGSIISSLWIFSGSRIAPSMF